MRILLAAPMPPSPQAPGAIPLVLHAELTGLISRHEVTVVTVAGPDPQEWEAVDRQQAEGIEVHAIRRYEPHGILRCKRGWRFVTAWLSGKYPWRTIWFWEPEIQRILDNLLSEDRFDLVIVEDNSMGIYQYHTETPTLFTEHEVRRPRPVNWQGWQEEGLIRRILKEADWQRWRPYQLSVWRRFDRIQVFSNRDQAAICEMAPELAPRVRVNPFGIDLPAPLDPAREQKGDILFVGNYTHPPNVDAAFWLGNEIMPLLRKRCPGARLTLVGPYPPESVQALACRDITVTGRVPEIEPYFEKSSVILAPVRIGGGMRMKVLQAMALGKPVVTTSRGADGLVIDGQKPPLVVADEAEEIARATAELLARDDYRLKTGCRARAFVAEHFSAQAYARRIEAIYAGIIQERTVRN